MTQVVKVVAVLITIALLTACANSPLSIQPGNPDVYARSQVMSVGQVMEGKVVMSRKVQIAGGNTTTGIGAAAGGAIGALVTRNSSSAALRTVGMVASAAAGGVIGNMAGTTEGNEIVVQFTDRSVRVVVQEPGSIMAAQGDTVLMLINGREARVIAKK